MQSVCVTLHSSQESDPPNRREGDSKGGQPIASRHVATSYRFQSSLRRSHIISCVHILLSNTIVVPEYDLSIGSLASKNLGISRESHQRIEYSQGTMRHQNSSGDGSGVRGRSSPSTSPTSRYMSARNTGTMQSISNRSRILGTFDESRTRSSRSFRPDNSTRYTRGADYTQETGYTGSPSSTCRGGGTSRNRDRHAAAADDDDNDDPHPRYAEARLEVETDTRQGNQSRGGVEGEGGDSPRQNPSPSLSPTGTTCSASTPSQVEDKYELASSRGGATTTALPSNSDGFTGVSSTGINSPRGGHTCNTNRCAIMRAVGEDASEVLDIALQRMEQKTKEELTPFAIVEVEVRLQPTMLY